MTKTELKAKALISHFENSNTSIKDLKSYAASLPFPWVDEHVVEKVWEWAHEGR